MIHRKAPLFLTKLFILFFFVIFPPLPLQADLAFSYKQLGIESGLIHPKVQSILYDYKGYLWIGTPYGLNCFDGISMKNYFYHPTDSFTLASNDILFITEDSLKNLWVGTEEGSLCLFDRKHSRFNRINYRNAPLPASSYLLVDGGILFGGIGDIYRYDYLTRKMTQLPIHTPQRINTHFKQLMMFNKQHLLINTRWYGIYSVETKTGRTNRLKDSEKNVFTSLFVDSQNRIWMGSYGNGLFCCTDKEIIRHFTVGNSPLSDNLIQDIKEKDGYLWVATDGGGINLISLSDFSFQHLTQFTDDITSFPSNAINCLYLDAMNNMWAGSVRNGVISIKKAFAKSYTNVPFGNQYGVSNKAICCFYQGKEGLIWIGTDGGGLNCLNPRTGLFRHYKQFSDQTVTSIFELDEQKLLISLYSEGLFTFDKKTGSAQPFLVMNKTENAKVSACEAAILIKKISTNKILISGNDIYLYDLQNKTFKIIASRGKEFKSIAPKMKIDRRLPGIVIILDNYNLCEYNLSTGSFSTFYQGQSTIEDVSFDDAGNLWIGCFNKLLHYDRTTQKSKMFDIPLIQGVKLLLEGLNSQLLIATQNHTLFLFDTNTKNFIKLGPADGISINDYDRGILTPEGRFCVGGSLGMAIIDGNNLFKERTVSTHIELLDCFFNDRLVDIGEDEQLLHFSFPWDFSSIRLRVRVNKENIFKDNIYCYTISNSDSRKEIQTLNSTLTINYLPVGNYKVQVSCITQAGTWSEPTEIATITITPPWWKSFWFVGISLFVVAGFVLMIIYILHKRERNKVIVEMKIKASAEKVRFLIQLNHDLRTPLTLICAPLKRILDSLPTSSDLKPKLEGIFKQTLFIKESIDTILDVQKLEDSHKLQITTVSFNYYVQSIVEPFKNEFLQRNIEIAYRLSPEIGKVPLDRDKYKSVLSNLLTNALKFSDSNTTVTVISRLTEGDRRVRVEVWNCGIGLGNVDSQRLFNPFYQGKHEMDGSGIGLAHSKVLMELQGGGIGTFDEEGLGTCFFIELPLTSKDGIELTQSMPETALVQEENTGMFQSEIKILKKYNILVVEDIAELSSYLKDVLSAYFAHVYTAKDGVEALEIISGRMPDIIVSDVMMPRMDGFELCIAIKKEITISHIPVILLTAYSQDANMTTGYKLGADAFIAKPFEMDMLLAVLVNQIKMRQFIKTKYQKAQMPSLQESTFSNVDELFLEKINTVIISHLSDATVHVSTLSVDMGCSHSLLYNKLKLLTGMSIVDYINKIKIEEACKLLQNTKLNLSEIAEMTGFSSAQYFSRVFKAIKGDMPSAYKKGQRQANTNQ